VPGKLIAHRVMKLHSKWAMVFSQRKFQRFARSFQILVPMFIVGDLDSLDLILPLNVPFAVVYDPPNFVRWSVYFDLVWEALRRRKHRTPNKKSRDADQNKYTDRPENCLQYLQVFRPEIAVE
jgi:hypothetical protein